MLEQSVSIVIYENFCVKLFALLTAENHNLWVVVEVKSSSMVSPSGQMVKDNLLASKDSPFPSINIHTFSFVKISKWNKFNVFFLLQLCLISICFLHLTEVEEVPPSSRYQRYRRMCTLFMNCDSPLSKRTTS